MALKKETKPAKAVAKTKAVKKEAAPKAKKPAAKGKALEVEFKVFAPASGSVAVAGDFNDWKPTALKKSKNGNWAAKIKLNADGIYQYKIVYDGQYWETDKSNPERVSDGHGGENSILRV
jgi:1,4-alpha-glucan branching enzyme